MAKQRYLSAKEAADTLQISRSTLYAYVSRGLIRSEPSSGGKRQRRYYAEDVDKLLARKEGRRNPEKLAQDALHWGTPVMDSAITLIDRGQVYYRGENVCRLAREATVEQVAAFIWAGQFDRASQLFSPDANISAQPYETMLLHIEMDGAETTPIQEIQTMLTIAESDDITAYDLRPITVTQVGARIMRLMTSVLAGDVSEKLSIAQMLQQGWCPGQPASEALFTAALIVLADHELNASSFAARVVASAKATPYQVVLGGLAALRGIKHGGQTEQVAALFNEISDVSKIQPVLTARLRRGERIPGFGHRLYPEGDPRARLLIDLIRETDPDAEAVHFMNTAIDVAEAVLGEAPTVDAALAFLARFLKLPAGGPLALFALGRTIGWIGHAIEQYERDRLIRPRARYVGEHPAE